MSIEIIIILIYLIFVFAIAFSTQKKFKKNNTKREDIFREEYLAGQEVSTFESIFSIIATEVSALTFIGIPAFAFGLDFRFIYLYFGAIVGRALLAIYYLPKLYGKETTIYEKITDNQSSSEAS